MEKLIPAINAESFGEISEKIRVLEPLAEEFGLNYIHIDVADGTFTKNTIWHTPADLVGFETVFDLELHLMIADIDRRVDDWLIGSVRRIVFHLEAARDQALVLEKIKKSGKEAGIAINPETSWIKTEPYWSDIDLVQILGVHPGLAGQKMKPEIVDKIKGLREACKECKIEVDGGVNAENAGDLVRAGADYVVAASAIFSDDNIRENIKNLVNKISF